MIDALVQGLGEFGDAAGEAVAKGSAPGSLEELQSVLARVGQESSNEGGGDPVELGVRGRAHRRPRSGTNAPSAQQAGDIVSDLLIVASRPAGDQVLILVRFTAAGGVDPVLHGVSVDRFDSD